jgi:N-acetylglutamate synthase-like GNAT family acetyltransferase
LQGGIAYLGCVVTHEEWQGGGIGTLLCLLSLQFALRELGARFVGALFNRAPDLLTITH